jgi:tryptophanyl-tRNA synthetase
MRLVSGIKPTGSLTLGNYIGAIKQFIELQTTLVDTEMFIFIADLHALTMPIEKLTLKKHIKEVAALYLACGLNPDKVCLFAQSDISEHTQLSYVLESTAYIGELERMTQYKDKRLKGEEALKVSMFTYPTLMAADILLYDADLVPVGDDQKQHLELTRDLAQRFNHTYGETFVIPKGYQPKLGARIKSLTEPTKKMAKSDDSPKSYIALLDDLNQVRSKIKSAVTDSEASIYFDEVNKPGISNLLTIYASLKQMTIEEASIKFKSFTYQDFKHEVAEAVVETLEPIQKAYKEIILTDRVEQVLSEGKLKAKHIASIKINKVYKKLGLSRS